MARPNRLDCFIGEKFEPYVVVRACGDAEVKYRGRDGFPRTMWVARVPEHDAGTVLMAMAYNHDWPEAAAALIERGCGVNAKDKDGNTALHMACANGHEEIVAALRHIPCFTAVNGRNEVYLRQDKGDIKHDRGGGVSVAAAWRITSLPTLVEPTNVRWSTQRVSAAPASP